MEIKMELKMELKMKKIKIKGNKITKIEIKWKKKKQK